MASSERVTGGLMSSRPSRIVLGIDASLTGFSMTALAMTNDEYACWLYKPKGRGIERLMDIEAWLGERFGHLDHIGHQVKNIALEDTVVHSSSASVLGELAGIVKRTCWVNFSNPPARYPLRVPPTMVKKYATDKGTAKKNEMLLAVYKKWGVTFSDDNMADSFVLANMARGSANSAYEKTVLQKLEDPKFRDSDV